MFLSIEDLSENGVLTEHWEDVLTDTVFVVLDNLIKKEKTLEKIDLTILIDDDCFEEGCDGYCVEADKNVFEVSLGSHLWEWDEKVLLKEIVTVLSHELVHVAQLATGMMKYPDHTKAIYEKKTFILEEVDYDDRPWEEEAYALQDTLAAMVIDKING